MELGRKGTTEGRLHVTPIVSKDAAKDLELRMARFSITVRRLCSDVEIDSGVGQVIREHLLHYSTAAKDNMRLAFASKSKAKRRQLLDEARQQVYMVLHWLGQFDTSGDLISNTAKSCQVSGTGIAMDLAAMLGDAGERAIGAQAENEPETLRNRQLSDI